MAKRKKNKTVIPRGYRKRIADELGIHIRTVDYRLKSPILPHDMTTVLNKILAEERVKQEVLDKFDAVIIKRLLGTRYCKRIMGVTKLKRSKVLNTFNGGRVNYDVVVAANALVEKDKLAV